MTSKNAPPGRLAALDVIVLLAMAVTATAFATGLVLNSGIDMMAGAIAGAALFVLMASSHFVITRSARSATVTGRLDELEEALIVLDGDLQRIDQVEDDVARLDLLNDRVERLDQFVSEYGGGDATPKLAEIERLTQDLEQLRDRFDGLRLDLHTETQAQREEIGTELKSLESLIKGLSSELATASRSAVAPAPAAPSLAERLAETAGAPMELKISEENLLAAVPAAEAPDSDESPLELEDSADDREFLASDSGDSGVAETLTVVEVEIDEDDRVAEPEVEELVVIAAEETTPPRDLSEDLRQAIESNRIDLYVQPIVTVPERQVRYFDAVCRIRTSDDQLIETGYEDVAVRDGLMPRIDNMMLVKSVQLLRRLGTDSKLQGVFCNLSLQSLRDPDFFPELVEFLEENSALGDSLTFRLSQPSIQDLGAIELASLRTLGKIGFGFAIDQISNLDLDFAALRDHFFRFVKVEADTLLHGMEAAKATVSAADLAGHLDRFDLKLIVEKVAAEGSLEQLMQYGIELAEGDLFATPKPATAETLSELGGAETA